MVDSVGPFRTLYIDMNSFFASVEQHLDSSLRGRPLGITAMEEEVGICVAASVEAKRYGVKTGTPVIEAKRLAPGIAFRPSRHRLYVRFNLKLAGLFDRFAEVERIRSIDEFQIGLSGETSSLSGAQALVATLKDALRYEIGPTIRFSAGIGPNHLLAKIAGKLEKPDGCQWLSPDNMPERLAHMALDDLPGISRAMKARLLHAGVPDIATLYRLDPRHARLIWRSVEGERFVRALQGEAIPLFKTKRGGVDNSKVLAPEYRHPREAYLVSRWLIEKAAMRLRRAGMVAGRLHLHISRYGRPSFDAGMRCSLSQDTGVFLRTNKELWRSLWPRIKGAQLAAVRVHLGHVQLLTQRNGDLLLGLPPATRTTGERLSQALDFTNARYGAGTAIYGRNTPHPGFFERG